jgi:predicted transcriptional regulator
MRNLHVPLPEELHKRLQAEAQRSRRPATALAREAIDRWLEETRAAAIREEIGRYAQAHAGTAADLDLALEATGIEHLVTAGKRKKVKT